MMNKKGDEKYYIIISMILGLIVLTLSLYFIFQEYFTEDELDWQQCRQSVILRSNLPEIDAGWFAATSFKDSFPLKCKTEVVEIEKKDYDKDRVGEKIADVLAECWYTFLEGNAQLFPAQIRGFESYCVPCARVHFEDELASEGVEIDLLEALQKKMNRSSQSYMNYFNKGFSSSSTINYLIKKSEATEKTFKIEGDKLSVDDSDVTGFWNAIKNNFFKSGISDVTLPRYIDTSKGDVIIVIGQVISSDSEVLSPGENEGKESITGFNPQLFYFQIGQEDAFEELGKKFIQSDGQGASMCDQWDGVPA